ncbi:hypothetical protein Pcinc_036499 [Petrolisthes cinctipes]|uniref:C2H2-type domain-containing protein n=1 Tax=Petrolisthes cinctipes TaxID=88211 RepID=A0AAE1ENL9_PETCI|nr:hypothetical protein Pcinc_036499 [Petrolisthes cinctipes]
MFQQQAGPSGLHRHSGREGMTDEGEGGGGGRRGEGGGGGGLYPPHLLGDLPPTDPSHLTNQTGSTLLGGGSGGGGGVGDGWPVCRDEQGRLCYRCVYCSRVDSDKSKWRRHLRSHTGEKPFQCAKCPYRAATKHAVLRHDKFRHSYNTVAM